MNSEKENRSSSRSRQSIILTATLTLQLSWVIPAPKTVFAKEMTMALTGKSHNYLRVPIPPTGAKDDEPPSFDLAAEFDDDEGVSSSSQNIIEEERILQNAKWYVDWKYMYCAQDCPTSGPLSSPTCGGSAEPWQHLWSSAEECCNVHLSWQSFDFCTKFGHPDNLSEQNSFPENRQDFNRGATNTHCWRSGTPCSSMADSFACCSICSEGYCL